MRNGKGSSRRQFDRKREHAFKSGHLNTFGEREKVDGRKTVVVIQGNRLIEKNQNRDIFCFDPGTIPPTCYVHRDSRR